ncbi:hypothetical protein [Neobacillus niacini]|uniref:hypothetical protein n=1 Tax=Neobacillus niacini TaxID=86668 RepID=UPI0005ED5856|nr:hypothetical protein [Neobacillus niacini]
MLTPAQKKIRQNLEELRVNGLLLHDKKKAELPIKNNKRNYPLFSIFLLVTICSLLAIAVYCKQFDQSQESIINYLTHTQALSTESEKLLNDCLEQQARLKITEIEELSLKQEELMRKALDYAVPAGFSEHNHDFINLMEQRSSMINTFTAELKPFN